LISFFFSDANPVSELKGATQRALHQAPRSASPESTPSRAEWRLGFWRAFEIAVSDAARSQKLRKLIFQFLILNKMMTDGGGFYAVRRAGHKQFLPGMKNIFRNLHFF